MRNIILLLLLITTSFSCVKQENSKESAEATSRRSGDSALQEDYSGTWELVFINGERTPVNELFPDQKATVIFNEAMNQISGSTGCNNYSTPITVNGNSIAVGQIASTKKMCPGEGDEKFVEILPTITNFNRDGDNLNMSSRGMLMLRFTKVK